MKPFTNKLLLIVLAGVVLAACSSKEEPGEPVISETVTVQETVLPPTAQKVKEPETVAPAPQERIPAEPAQAETKAKPKTLYPNETVINLKAWDKKLKSLKTNFEQTTLYDGVQVSKSQGVLYYDKEKNLLRLDTLDTDGKTEQSSVTDKKQILILDGQGREVTTLPWQEWQQNQPNQALFDFGNYTALLNKHNVTLKEPLVLELTPQEGETYTLYITMDQQDFFPTDIKIVSDLLVTHAKLSNTKKNETLAFDTFRAGGLFK